MHVRLFVKKSSMPFCRGILVNRSIQEGDTLAEPSLLELNLIALRDAPLIQEVNPMVNLFGSAAPEAKQVIQKTFKQTH